MRRMTSEVMEWRAEVDGESVARADGVAELVRPKDPKVFEVEVGDTAEAY